MSPRTIAATDWIGVAALVGAVFAGIGLLIGSIAAAVVLVRVPKLVKETHTMTTQIDAAVNGKPPGTPSIGDDVAEAKAVLPLLVQVAADVKHLKGERKVTADADPDS